MDNLYDLLQNIKKKPTTYLVRPSIICLQAFLSGYNVAQYQLGIPLGTVTVPGKLSKDLAIGTLMSIWKQAQLED